MEAGTDTDVIGSRRIDLDLDGAVLGLLSVDRPEAMNAVNPEIARVLRGRFDQLAEDPDVRVIAITGSGPAFSAGGDLEAYRVLQRDPVAFPKFFHEVDEMLAGFSTCEKPCIALVNGVAVAGGLELLLACDLAFAAESARIGDGHLTFGQIGGGGVLTLLPRAVGPARARELILSGRLLEAAEALDWGLVSRVVPDDELLQAGIEFARDVARKSPLAVSLTKRVLNASLRDGTGVEAGVRLEQETVFRYCLTSHDAEEGLAAFAEKRKPRYEGR